MSKIIVRQAIKNDLQDIMQMIQVFLKKKKKKYIKMNQQFL